MFTSFTEKTQNVFAWHGIALGCSFPWRQVPPHFSSLGIQIFLIFQGFDFNLSSSSLVLFSHMVHRH